MECVYKTQGTCAREIHFELDENKKIHNVYFVGGCNGNLKAISKLIEGMDAAKVVEILEGNTCGGRPTSCADQLTKGIKENL